MYLSLYLFRCPFIFWPLFSVSISLTLSLSLSSISLWLSFSVCRYLSFYIVGVFFSSTSSLSPSLTITLASNRFNFLFEKVGKERFWKVNTFDYQLGFFRRSLDFWPVYNNEWGVLLENSVLSKWQELCKVSHDYKQKEKYTARIYVTGGKNNLELLHDKSSNESRKLFLLCACGKWNVMWYNYSD